MTRFISFALLIALISNFGASHNAKAAATEEDSETKLLIEQVSSLVEKGENLSALTKLNEALEVKEADPWLLATRGMVYQNLEDNKTALVDFGAALKINPCYTFAWKGAAKSLYDLGDFQFAASFGDEAIKLDQSDSEVYTLCGRSKFKLQRYKEAITDLTRAISLGENDTSVFETRADSYIALKPTLDDLFIHKDFEWNSKAAIEDLNQAIKLAPLKSALYVKRASQFGWINKPTEALKDDMKAILLDPTNQWAFYLRGRHYSQLKSPIKAIADFSTALKLAPSDERTRYMRGIEHLKIGNNALALADFDFLISKGAESHWCALSMIEKGDLCKKAGDAKGALALFDKAVAKEPKAISYFARSKYYRSIGSHEKGVSDFIKALSDGNPDETQKEDLKYARESYYTQLIAEYPKQPIGYINRAKAWFNLAKFERALEDSSLAISMAPKSGEAFMVRGLAYRKLGQTDKSIHDFEEAVKLNPSLASKIALSADKL